MFVITENFKRQHKGRYFQPASKARRHPTLDVGANKLYSCARKCLNPQKSYLQHQPLCLFFPGQLESEVAYESLIHHLIKKLCLLTKHPAGCSFWIGVHFLKLKKLDCSQMHQTPSN